MLTRGSSHKSVAIVKTSHIRRQGLYTANSERENTIHAALISLDALHVRQRSDFLRLS
jgi:hypothetical protein